MKLLNAILLLSTLAAIAMAQSIVIGYPPANNYVHPNQNLTVQVAVQPEILVGPITIGLAIGIAHCSESAPCRPASETVGDIFLYAGPYEPELHSDPGYPTGRFYQNFTVYIPSVLSKGRAQLTIALPGFIGAGDYLLWETSTQMLNVV